MNNQQQSGYNVEITPIPALVEILALVQRDYSEVFAN